MRTVTRDERSASALIPACLVAIRVELTLVILGLAHFAAQPFWFSLILTMAFMIDLALGFAGHRAERRLAFVLRVNESVRGACLFAAVYAAWVLHPDAVQGGPLAMASWSAIVMARWYVDLRKFGAPIRYRTWAGEAWYTALGLTLFCVFACGVDAAAVSVVLYIAVAVEIEKLIISLLLERGQAAVPSVFHALDLSRRI